MRFSKTSRRGVALVALAAASTLFAAGCSAGSLGSSSSQGSAGGTTITFLIGATDTTVASAKAVIDCLQSRQSRTSRSRCDTRPGGSDGDNLVKTRLSTGDMSEVFIYNNGSLLQAMKPEQNLTPLDDQPWASQIDQTFADSLQGLRRQAIRRSVRARRSAAGCCTTFRSTRSSASRSRRPGTSS